MLTRRMKNGREEAGVVLVIYTLAIVAVLLFAALAFDLGNIAQTKQHAQNAADSAALSAVWDLAPNFNGGIVANDEIQAVTDVNNYLNHNYSSVQTPLGMTSCGPLPGPLPAGVTPSTSLPNGTDCVGFYPAGKPNTIVVVIPGQNVNFTFGRVGGNTSQAVSAMAEASLTSPGPGFELPYAFCISAPPLTSATNCSTPSAGIYGLQCLKTGSGGSANNGACTGQSLGPGNFGEVFSPRYLIYPFQPGNPQKPTAGSDVEIADVDLGLDHTLVRNPSAPSNSGNVCDYVGPSSLGGTCASFNDGSSLDPLGQFVGDAVVTDTGETLNEAGPGLFNADVLPFTVDGCTFTVPRFNHPSGFAASGNCSQDNQSSSRAQTCPSTGSLVIPCLSSAAASSFGSNLPLNGVHITDYLNGCSAPPGQPYGAGGTGGTQCATSDVTANDPTNSSLWSCYEGHGPSDDANSPSPNTPSATKDAIDATTNDTNATTPPTTVWSFGDASNQEDACLSTQIQGIASNMTCTNDVASDTTLPDYCQPFSTDMAESPRFGQVPVVTPVSGGGKKGDAIVTFDDVFLYQASGHTGKVDAINAWVFPSWMVQNGPVPGQPGGPPNNGPLTANLCSLAATPGPNC